MTIPVAPLHQAAMQGDIATIKRLVAEGADINETNPIYMVTPLALAASNASPDVLRTMVELGANILASPAEAENGTPLRMAVMAGKADNVQALLELGADVNEANPKNGTLLHAAAKRGSKQIVKMLIQAGADLDRPGPNGQTPLDVVQTQRKQMEEAMKTMRGMPVPPQLQQHVDGLKELEKFLSGNHDEKR
ncbi:hypothetical protein DTL42_07270 [Bremerella cremea]|uniref:Ankyrin repeat domain-containing protein n=1 Tax=Bremerella cremea TaxID=1031537 RepID=A0A368KV82_9BACT|nr:ankyrin repeat domain-containing protein [Bremerella cremea]RCS52631.1 hypothetical protein DTL42_07270 [Bremerella cremea]